MSSPRYLYFLPILSSLKSTANTETKLPDPTEILVGSNSRRFLAPPHLLTKVPFFRACLDTPMQESTSGTIKLPEDNGEAFVEVIDYMFHDRLGGKLKMQTVNASPQSLRHPSVICTLRGPEMNLAADTYNLACKLGMEDLPNAIIDEIRRYHNDKPEQTEMEFRSIFECPRTEDTLRSYFLQPLASDIKRLGWAAWVVKNQSVYEQFLGGSVSSMEIVVGALALKGGNRTPSYGGCEWHVHIDKPTCRQMRAARRLEMEASLRERATRRKEVNKDCNKEEQGNVQRKRLRLGSPESDDGTEQVLQMLRVVKRQ